MKSGVLGGALHKSAVIIFHSPFLGLCYVVKERISSNQNRVFLNFKMRFKYVLIYVESSEKVHLT